MKEGRKVMVTVRVVWGGSGRPVQGSKVTMASNCGISSPEITDANGETEFPDYMVGDECWIYVDGEERFHGYARPNHQFSI